MLKMVDPGQRRASQLSQQASHLVTSGPGAQLVQALAAPPAAERELMKRGLETARRYVKFAWPC
jgi:hypothetical protein